MAITPAMSDSVTLMGVQRQFEPQSNYWLDLCFGRQMTFDTEFIEFEKMHETRKLAPFVRPTTQGKPMGSEGSEVRRFKPAYIKPKDSVQPARLIRRQPGEISLPQPQSIEARFNAAKAEILRVQRVAIERRWEWMAAQAIINGSVVIAGEDYPSVTVDFGRDASHTVPLLGAGFRWNESGADIIGDIEGWRDLCRKAKFGGGTNRLTVGTDVWEAMRKNGDLLKLLDTQIRGTNGAFETGVREGGDVEYVGRLSSSLDLYVYSDYYQDASGTEQPFMSSKDVVLTGPGVDGVRAFGAILDSKANLQPTPIFPKMWEQEDPSGVFIMSQSAPLMVPLNPNNTLKATVLA